MTSPQSRLWLAHTAVHTIQNLANEKYPNETGGMLLGYETNGDVVVANVIGPGGRAKHRCNSFVPDSEFQQLVLEALFRKTDGRETYLGDWHTHPNGPCNPSTTDKKTLAHIARTAASRTAHPVMVILGGKPDNWTWGAIKFLKIKRHLIANDHELRELSILFFDDRERIIQPQTDIQLANTTELVDADVKRPALLPCTGPE